MNNMVVNFVTFFVTLIRIMCLLPESGFILINPSFCILLSRFNVEWGARNNQADISAGVAFSPIFLRRIKAPACSGVMPYFLSSATPDLYKASKVCFNTTYNLYKSLTSVGLSFLFIYTNLQVLHSIDIRQKLWQYCEIPRVFLRIVLHI